MKIPYTPPLIEQWVTDTFISNDILYPSDLKPEKIAKSFAIDYLSWDGIICSFRDPKTNKLFILDNKGADDPTRRIHLLHELAHILRHAGDQRNMIESFRKKQEWDAKLFTLYASIPFHMIDFEQGYTLKSIMQEFHVTKELAYTRIEDIRTKILSEQQMKREQHHPSFIPYCFEKCSDETKRIIDQLSRQTGVKYF